MHQFVKQQDELAKSKIKQYADKKLHTKTANFEIGDMVLTKQHKLVKSDSNFDHNPYKIIEINGSMITATQGNNKKITRNSSFFRKTNQNNYNSIEPELLVDDDDDDNSKASTTTDTTENITGQITNTDHQFKSRAFIS